MRNRRVIISGGGTGGHIFPAIAIANSLRELDPEIEILFVGAEGKMEMEKVPQAGYRIEGLPVAGLQRSLSLSNLKLPFKIMKSLRKAGKIIREFRPDCAVGVGGYASAPLIWSASGKGIPCLIQEQNSYAGLTNKIMGKRAVRICTAYENMDKFFPADKIILTGNPIRKEILSFKEVDKEEAYRYFGLNPELPVVFMVGGSLGCGTFNRCMKRWISENALPEGVQFIWQSGKYYREGIDAFFRNLDGAVCSDGCRRYGNVTNYDFVSRMDYIYSISDIIISRAGAGTISELCCAGKACIFVPSPNVAEDHQTHNAMALVNKDAAMMIPDAKAETELLGAIKELIADKGRISTLEENILKLALPQAGRKIAEEIIKIIGEK